MKRPAAGPAWWPAPAKLNLFLRVTGRRADGYHQLQTVFQLLDHGDRIRVEARTDGRLVRRAAPAGIDEAGDLTLRAARALGAGEAGRGAGIELDKRVPLGGGLGGGSSDAATTLVALDRLWGLGRGEERLAEIGLALGADVPVFVRGVSAWAEGVGERLRPVSLGEYWYVVITPAVELSTAAVFGAPALTRNSTPLKISDFLCDRANRDAPRLDVPALVAHGGNDCEPVARAMCPEIGRALDWLGRFGPARMTGTGASVFLACEREAAAREVLARVPGDWRGFAARGLDRSPLRGLLAADR